LPNLAFGSSDGTPSTPEELKTERAEIAVLNNLPDGEMSKDDMEKLVLDAEKSLPDDEPIVSNPAPVPSTIPSSIPEVKKPSTTLLTDNSPKTEPKVEPKVETKPEPKVEPKPEPKVQPKPEPKKEEPSSSWPAVKPKPKKPTETKPTVPPVVKPVPPTSKPVEKPAPKPIEKPVQKPVQPPVQKPVTQPAPIPSPVAVPVTPPTDDNGVDADDQNFDETYNGPKNIVDHPRSTADFQLSEVAAQLGSMTPKKGYLDLQKSLMGSRLKSCNYFFITALIESNLATSRNFPGWMAASLDTKYFEPKGWKRIDLDTLKQWFRDAKTFDVAIQRNAPRGKAHGHVAIPVGLNSDGNVMVAEASYLTESNRIAVYKDASLATKFKIYVRE
jgi:hypothetical protein